MKLIPGSSNKELCKEIAKKLNIPLTNIHKKVFSDGEFFIKINESIRGHDCFIIQSTSYPANDNIMELLLTIDALKRASAKSINVIIPYYGYARQDRKSEPRVPISAKLVANLIENSGANRVVTIDIHASQIQGFFDIPVDNLYGSKIFVKEIKEKIENKQITEPLIASPDAGGVVRARYFAKSLNIEGFAMIDKRREKANESEVMNVIGDVSGKDVIIVDDIIDTGGTLVKAAKAFKENGAKSVRACISHGVLSGKAFNVLQDDALDELIITDTIKQTKKMKKITVLSTKELLTEVIRRIVNNESINSLF